MGITGRTRRAYAMWPRRHLMCVLRRVVNTVRFFGGVPLRNTRFAEADLRGASTGREVAHRLAYPSRGHGVTAVPHPATLTKQ